MLDRLAEFLEQSLPKKSTRRKFLFGAAGITVAGTLGVSNLEGIANLLEQLAQTPEQKEALKQFSQRPPEKRLRNLIVGKDGAILRVRPLSYSPEPGAVKEVGKLNYGDPPIPEAIEVLGNNPHHPESSRLTNSWVFIPLRFDKEGKATIGVFSYAGNFEKIEYPKSSNP